MNSHCKTTCSILIEESKSEQVLFVLSLVEVSECTQCSWRITILVSGGLALPSHCISRKFLSCIRCTIPSFITKFDIMVVIVCCAFNVIYVIRYKTSIFYIFMSNLCNSTTFRYKMSY